MWSGASDAVLSSMVGRSAGAAALPALREALSVRLASAKGLEWSIAYDPALGQCAVHSRGAARIKDGLNANSAALLVARLVQNKLAAGYVERSALPAWVLAYRKGAGSAAVQEVEASEAPAEPLELVLTKGNRWWRVLVEGGESVRSWGVQGGKAIEKRTTYRVGKAGRSVNQQARVDALADAKRKMDRDGFSQQDQEQQQQQQRAESSHEREHEQHFQQQQDQLGKEQGEPVPLPMLARVFEQDIVEEQERVLVQPKLDGLRCLADLETGQLWSRARKAFTTLGHIADVVRGTARPGLRWVDGEVYLHGMAIQTLNSVVRSGGSSPEERARVQLHVFDAVVLGPDFEERWARVSEWHQSLGVAQGAVKLSATEEHAAADLPSLHARRTLEGYEGLMVRRKLASPYAPGKRSKALLKFKAFQREEFRCIDVVEQRNVADGEEPAAGAFVLELPSGARFNATPKTTLADKREMWREREKYKSGEYVAMVQFFEKAQPSDVPRFPVLVGFRHRDDL